MHGLFYRPMFWVSIKYKYHDSQHVFDLYLIFVILLNNRVYIQIYAITAATISYLAKFYDMRYLIFVLLNTVNNVAVYNTY